MSSPILFYANQQTEKEFVEEVYSLPTDEDTANFMKALKKSKWPM